MLSLVVVCRWLFLLLDGFVVGFLLPLVLVVFCCWFVCAAGCVVVVVVVGCSSVAGCFFVAGCFSVVVYVVVG